MAIDLVTNRHKKMQNMNIDKMSNYLGNELGLCCHEKDVKVCSVSKSCTQCWKEFLLGDDTL